MKDMLRVDLFAWSEISFEETIEPDRERYKVALATLAMNFLFPKGFTSFSFPNFFIMF